MRNAVVRDILGSLTLSTSHATFRNRDVRRSCNGNCLGLRHIEVLVCNLTFNEAYEMLLEKEQKRYRNLVSVDGNHGSVFWVNST